VDAYQQIIDESRRVHETRFRLSHCPLPDFDAPWGTDAYLAWAGRPGLAVYVEGRDPVQTDGTVIQCRVQPVMIGAARSGVMHPVRSVAYVSDEGRGVAAYDYWVAADIDGCDALIAGNPNVDGSPGYRESARYAILFSNVWDGRQSEVVRRVSFSALGGALQARATLVVDDREQELVPLARWTRDRRGRPAPGPGAPLLRLAIAHASATNVGAYDRVVLECR
jgi:hypothetical protein